jgi:hypothetical protein
MLEAAHQIVFVSTTQYNNLSALGSNFSSIPHKLHAAQG